MRSDTITPHKFLRLAIDFSEHAAQDDSAAVTAGWFDLAGRRNPDPSQRDNVRRIRVEDLRAAQKERIRIRQELQAAGQDPGSVDVLVDITVLINPDARIARAKLSSLVEQPDSHSLQYVGTPAGLAVLIADIKAAEVADGVTLRPIGGWEVIRHIFRETVPWLEERGLLQFKAIVPLLDDDLKPSQTTSRSI